MGQMKRDYSSDTGHYQEKMLGKTIDDAMFKHPQQAPVYVNDLSNSHRMRFTSFKRCSLLFGDVKSGIQI